MRGHIKPLQRGRAPNSILGGQMSFVDFFQTATRNMPYDYQSRLAVNASSSRQSSNQVIVVSRTICLKSESLSA